MKTASEYCDLRFFGYEFVSPIHTAAGFYRSTALLKNHDLTAFAFSYLGWRG